MMNMRRFLAALMALVLLAHCAALGEADDLLTDLPEPVTAALEPEVGEDGPFDLGDAALPEGLWEVPNDGEGQTTLTLFDTRRVSRTIEIDETLCIIVDIDGVTVRKWSSSKTKVAKVTDYGEYALVKPVAEGTTRLTAKLSDKQKIIVTVTVVDPAKPASVYFTESSVSLPVGDRYYLDEIVALTPESAVSTYTWKSSSKKIASVDAGGVLTGRKAGSTKVTVTTRNKKKATLPVTVLPNRVTGLSGAPLPRDISAVEGRWTLWPLSVELLSNGGLACEFYLLNGTPHKSRQIESMRLSLAVGSPDNVIADHLFARTKVSCKSGSSRAFKVSFPAGTVLESDIYLPDYRNALYFDLIDPEAVSLRAGKYYYDYEPTAFPVPEPTVPVTSIALSPESALILPGDSLAIQAAVRPDNATDPRLIWTTDAPAVATVDDAGRVTAHAQGTATITATAADGSGVSASCAVTVDLSAAYVKLSQNRLTLTVDERAALTAEPVPPDPSIAGTRWESSAPTVASVADGSVTALSVGTAVITVTMVSASGITRTGTCEVTVEAAPPVSVTGIELTPASTYLSVAQTLRLNATVYPENATDPSIAWTSSREDVASVAGGLVTARATGTAVITATTVDGGFTATCQVTVTAPGSEFITENGAVVGYVGAGGSVILPAKGDDGKTIVAVGPSAFEGSALSAVELPDTLRTIGARAFAGTGLRSAVIPSGVREIADDAFAGCDSLELTVYKDSYADQWCADHGVTAWRIMGLGVSSRSQSAIRAFISEHPADTATASAYRVTPSTAEPFAPGLLTEATIQNALNMVNQCRYIAGLNANVVNDPEQEEAVGAIALVNALNRTLSHSPERPEALSDSKYDALFAHAQKAASASNLGSGWGNLANSVLSGYMFDSDAGNISRLGHRRWILNPSMGKTAFGCCDRYSGMYVFDRSGSGRQTRVAWPASQTPTAFFRNTAAWSVSYGQSLNAADIQVTLTRRSDDRSWHFSSTSADGQFYVNNANYGITGCVIFLPDGLTAISTGDVYDVAIANAADHTLLKYSVTFFE